MKATWQDFISRAQALRYPTVVDADGATLISIPEGYIAQATDGPAGPRIQIIQGTLDILYDTPARADVEAFLKRVAPR